MLSDTSRTLCDLTRGMVPESCAYVHRFRVKQFLCDCAFTGDLISEMSRGHSSDLHLIGKNYGSSLTVQFIRICAPKQSDTDHSSKLTTANLEPRFVADLGDTLQRKMKEALSWGIKHHRKE